MEVVNDCVVDLFGEAAPKSGLPHSHGRVLAQTSNESHFFVPYLTAGFCQLCARAFLILLVTVLASNSEANLDAKFKSEGSLSSGVDDDDRDLRKCELKSNNLPTSKEHNPCLSSVAIFQSTEKGRTSK